MSRQTSGHCLGVSVQDTVTVGLGVHPLHASNDNDKPVVQAPSRQNEVAHEAQMGCLCGAARHRLKNHPTSPITAFFKEVWTRRLPLFPVSERVVFSCGGSKCTQENWQQQQSLWIRRTSTFASGHKRNDRYFDIKLIAVGPFSPPSSLASLPPSSKLNEKLGPADCLF